MKHIMARGNPAPHRAKRGSALLEYILLTGVSVGALLLPFGDDNQSVIKRLTEAVRKDHSGYMYMAGLPSLPRTDTLAGGLPGTDPGGNAPPGEGPNPTPPVAAPGPGTEPQPGLPGGPLPLPGPGLPLPVGGPVAGPDMLPVSVPLPAVPPIGVPGGPVIVGPAPVGGPGTGPAPVVTLPTEVPLPTLPVSPPGGGGGDTPNSLPRFPQPGTPGNPINTIVDGPAGGPDNGAPVCLAQTPITGTGIFSPSSTSTSFSASPSSSNRSAFQGAAQPTSIAATHVGNPIHVVTGNKYQLETDLTPLPGAMALSFTRHYNSRTPYRGALGFNWRHNFEVGLLEVQDQQQIDGAVQGQDRIHLWQADGRRIDFTPVARGQTPHLPKSLRQYEAAQHSDGQLTAGPFGYQWRWRDGTALDFAPNGKLQTITNAQGQVFKLGYDHSDRLIKLTDAQQRSLHLKYNRYGQLQTVTDPGNQVTHYHYDGDQNLIRVQYPDQTFKIYHYEDENDTHNLTGISVGSGIADDGAIRIATWAYDDQDRAISSEHANGSDKVSLHFDKAGQTTVTDARGRQSIYRNSTRQDIPTVDAIYGPGCNQCGQGDVAYRYNDRMQIIALAYKDGSELHYSYDALGRTIAALIALPGQDAVEYAGFTYLGDSDKVSQMRIPSVRPHYWRTMQVSYDGNQRPTQVTETGFAPKPDGSFAPITRSQRFTYKGRDRLVAVDGYRDDIEDLLKLEWGESGTSRTVFPDGGSFEVLTVDAHGRASKIKTDSSGPLDLIYNPQGQIASVSNNARSIKFDYDTRGQIAALRMGDQRIALSQRQDINPAYTGVDPATPLTNLLAYARTRLPDALQRNHFLSFTDARGNATRYAYDDFGRRAFTLSPDTGLSQYIYDGDNHLISQTDANGLQAVFDYDASGRIVRTKVGDTPTEFQWQGPPGARQLAAIHADDQREIRTLDAQGRVRAITLAYAAHRYTTKYRYNDQGRLQQKTLPDGRSLIYRYHSNGALAAIEQKSHLPFKPNRPLLSGLNDESAAQVQAGIADWQALNGITTQIQRNPETQQLAGIRIGRLHDLRYRYAMQGSIQGKITGIDDASRISHRYRYDANGRLDFALTPDALYGYRYDANGNRTRLIVNGQHIDYAHATDSNRLIQTRAAAPAWHAPLRLNALSWASDSAVRITPLTNTSGPIHYKSSGEITHLGSFQFRYNANGQPEHLYQGDAHRASYQYNSRAQRIAKKTASGVTTYYLYENNRLSAEINEQGRVQRQYLYLDHHPIAILELGQNYAVHTNHLGAPIAVTDQHQTVIWQARYAPFGKAGVDEDPDGNGIGFTLNLRLPGQYFDEESGLHYNHHRYYDPIAGRYISSDPLGLAAGPNTYAYVENDPVNHIDPTGLLLFAFDGTGNNDPAEEISDISNVVRFNRTYIGDANEPAAPNGRHTYYISGAGTFDPTYGISGNEYDAATGASIVQRVVALGEDFLDYIESLERLNESSFSLNIDVVGFSRGAASARMFVNLISDYLAGENHHDLVRNSGFNNVRINFDQRAQRLRRSLAAKCIRPVFRFLGLWDSVPHYYSQDNDIDQLQLSIPDAVEHVAHAVAATENRIDFQAISIFESAEEASQLRGSRGVRTERGFIGAHSDIGGGYAEGDLSDIAFLWMVRQAEISGAKFDLKEIESQGWEEISSPVLHDSVGVSPVPGVTLKAGRKLRYLNGTEIDQASWSGFGMDTETSRNYHDERYVGRCQSGRGLTRRCNGLDHEGNRTLVGMVDKGSDYGRWLEENYGLANSKQQKISILIDPTKLENGRPVPSNLGARP